MKRLVILPAALLVFVALSVSGLAHEGHVHSKKDQKLGQEAESILAPEALEDHRHDHVLKAEAIHELDPVERIPSDDQAAISPSPTPLLLHEHDDEFGTLSYTDPNTGKTAIIAFDEGLNPLSATVAGKVFGSNVRSIKTTDISTGRVGRYRIDDSNGQNIGTITYDVADDASAWVTLTGADGKVITEGPLTGNNLHESDEDATGKRVWWCIATGPAAVVCAAIITGAAVITAAVIAASDDDCGEPHTHSHTYSHSHGHYHGSSYHTHSHNHTYTHTHCLKHS